jgi:hypothetical protein
MFDAACPAIESPHTSTRSGRVTVGVGLGAGDGVRVGLGSARAAEGAAVGETACEDGVTGLGAGAPRAPVALVPAHATVTPATTARTSTVRARRGRRDMAAPLPALLA